MQEFLTILDSKTIDTFTVSLRVGLIILFAGVVGWNREGKNHGAGFRTHILIGLASTVLMLLSIFIPEFYSVVGGDPSRIAAQVVSGVGFLCAGAIMKFGLTVKGLNTAASIWIVSAIGLLVGAGLYYAGFLTTVATLIILVLFDLVEERYFGKYEYKVLILDLKQKKFHRKGFKELLLRNKLRLVSESFMQDYQTKNAQIKLTIAMPRDFDILKIVDEFRNLADVIKISIEST
ncbi:MULTISPECIES: MgtC/SapB family protein [unclassified Leptospira]|jgi:putative Mg2+ transporter-C (MgtC) family protein|uniref:MgtC/SapB family protein n=1 Tax=unclassified Leptospira TaxID=2633828 RepID=UPI0002BEF148|nr:MULTISPECIES: MgtC/SapB family protein [unclassified Leptospira]EMJ99841.1 Mg2+ transporter-C, MgtC family [Leptospira sp. B5-022]MCR1795235.1 MgtC/SapB family protein [Leptospira sp. id769339]